MLGRLHTSDIRRFIPRLIHQNKEATVYKQTLSLYQLGWDEVDKYKHDEHVKWFDTYWRSKVKEPESWPTDTLPAKFDKHIKSLVFAIPYNYLREINHFTQLFITERLRERGFDTCVRDRCLTVSAEAINNAFYLLCDCQYDEQREKWARGYQKRIDEYLMRYKFWHGYTGRGLLFEKSGLDELERYADLLDDDKIPFHEGDAETQAAFRNVLKTIREWAAGQDTAYPNIGVECEEASGEEANRSG